MKNEKNSKKSFSQRTTDINSCDDRLEESKVAFVQSVRICFLVSTNLIIKGNCK